MPTERFYKLPEEKRDAIKKAASDEFNSVPMQDVSINRIIKAAGISRGSFYTYFEDKDDVLSYLLNEMHMSLMDALRSGIVECEGDFIRAAGQLFIRSLKFMEEHYSEFNACRNSALKTSMISIQTMIKCSSDFDLAMREMVDWLWQNYDRTKYSIETKEELEAIFSHALMNMGIYTARIATYPEKKDLYIRQHEVMLKVLGYGATHA